MRDDPRLVGKPLAVGGRPERRGVVATCNYEARKFGIHSAMPMAQAVKRCPDLLIVPPSMEKYREVARQIFAIYHSYTPLVEPLSLDEAYLDVTDSPMLAGSGTRIAEDIRRRVREEIGITVSAGVAPNKFIAKIASDWNKPDGLFVVRPEQIGAMLDALAGRFGSTEVKPIHARADAAAIRIVVRATRGARGKLVLRPPLFLHAPGSDRFSTEADAINNGLASPFGD